MHACTREPRVLPSGSVCILVLCQFAPPSEAVERSCRRYLRTRLFFKAVVSSQNSFEDRCHRKLP